MEADHREAPADVQQLERTRERAPQLPEFVVDVHAQRLEGARRRILARLAVRTVRATRSASCSVVVRGSSSRCVDYLRGDAPGETLFPERRDHVANLGSLARASHAAGFAARRVHAHVERAVRAGS